MSCACSPQTQQITPSSPYQGAAHARGDESSWRRGLAPVTPPVLGDKSSATGARLRASGGPTVATRFARLGDLAVRTPQPTAVWVSLQRECGAGRRSGGALIWACTRHARRRGGVRDASGLVAPSGASAVVKRRSKACRPAEPERSRDTRTAFSGVSSKDDRR